MNLKFSNAAIALALSASDVVSSNIDANAALINHLESSDRKESDNAKVTNGTSQQRQVKEFQFASKAIASASDGDSSAPNVDVGFLGRRRRAKGLFPASERRLQTATADTAEEEETCIRPDTCEPNLCDCVADGGRGFDCAEELHAVCRGVNDDNGNLWTIGGCVGNEKYYENAYCPFAECIVEGGTYASCDCDFYNTVCDIYRDDAYYGVAVYPDMASNCAVAACCNTKVDDAGRILCFPEEPPVVEVPVATPAAAAVPVGVPVIPASTPAVQNSSPTETRPTTPDRPATTSTPPAVSDTVSSPTPEVATPVATPLDAPAKDDTGAAPAAETTANGVGTAATSDGADVPATVSVQSTSSSAAQGLMPWSILGATTSFVAATMIWSILG